MKNKVKSFHEKIVNFCVLNYKMNLGVTSPQSIYFFFLFCFHKGRPRIFFRVVLSAQSVTCRAPPRTVKHPIAKISMRTRSNMADSIKTESTFQPPTTDMAGADEGASINRITSYVLFATKIKRLK